MRRLLLATAFLCLAVPAWAQYPTPTFQTHTTLGPATMNGGGSLGGTWSGNPTFSGTPTFSGGLTSTGLFTGNGTIKMGTGSGNASLLQGTSGAVWSVTLGAASGRLGIFTSGGTELLSVGNTNVNVQTRATLLMTPTAVWSGNNYNTNSLATSNLNWSGTSTTKAYPLFFQMNDNIDSSTGGGLLDLETQTGGAAMTGSRVALLVNAKMTAAAPSNTNPLGQNMSGANIFYVATHDDGGTSSAPRGGGFGFNHGCNVFAAATNTYNCVAAEGDLTTETPVWVKFGYHVGYAGSDAFEGIYDDAAFTVDGGCRIGEAVSCPPGRSVPAFVGTRFAYSVGRTQGGYWPVDINNGTLFGLVARDPQSSDVMQAAYGVDILQASITNYAWRSRGASINGSGDLQIGTGILKAVATGISLDAPGVVSTAVALAAGGTNYAVGNVCFFANGGKLHVTTVGGSNAVTAFVVDVLPAAPSVASEPANPVATTCPGSAQQPAPSGLTVNITWDATRTAINLAGASSKLGFFGATPIVKATPVGACAGNTGCQALRDALGSLGLINTGSITN